MFAVASGQANDPASQMLETSGVAPRRSLVAALRHAMAVGAVATVLQLLVLVALLYACGVIAS